MESRQNMFPVIKSTTIRHWLRCHNYGSWSELTKRSLLYEEDSALSTYLMNTLWLITVTSWWAHRPHDCFLNHLLRRRSKKTSKLRVTGLCGGNSPVSGEFRAQRASNAEKVSIWWRHHVFALLAVCEGNNRASVDSITSCDHSFSSL